MAERRGEESTAARFRQALLGEGEQQVERRVGQADPREADRGRGLVEHAVRLHARGVLADPRAVAERRLAAVARTRPDTAHASPPSVDHWV